MLFSNLGIRLDTATLTHFLLLVAFLEVLVFPQNGQKLAVAKHAVERNTACRELPQTGRSNGARQMSGVAVPLTFEMPCQGPKSSPQRPGRPGLTAWTLGRSAGRAAYCRRPVLCFLWPFRSARACLVRTVGLMQVLIVGNDGLQKTHPPPTVRTYTHDTGVLRG